MKQSAAIGDSLRKQVEKRAKALVLEVVAELRKSPARGGTPVDTGHARANWITSVGAAHAGEVEGSGAYTAGLSEVLAWRLSDQPLWVANGVPYIQNLNYGSSKQAPALFVEAAVDRALASVEKKFGSGGGISQSSFRDEMGGIGAVNLASAYNPLGGDDE